MGIDTGGISCCFDRESEGRLEEFRREGLGDTSTIIADSIGRDGLSGAAVLELGCGLGALALELVRRGARSAVGVDLSPELIRLGMTLAAEAGLSASVSFQLGDAAVAKLESSDIVILDAVLCCYPDASRLVDNSSSAARRFLAVSMSDDRRFAARLLRIVLPLQRVLARRGFRFFIHSVGGIKEGLESKGFRLISETTAGWVWSVFLYAAPGAG